MKKHKTVDIVLAMVKKNPRVSLAALCEATGIESKSNILYHLRRLEARQSVCWLGQEKRRRLSDGQRARRAARGELTLPKHSKEEEKRLINKVVRKALRNPSTSAGEDVVRTSGLPLFTPRMKAVRVG